MSKESKRPAEEEGDWLDLPDQPDMWRYSMDEDFEEPPGPDE